MDEAEIAWGLLGISGTLTGVGGLIWGVATWSLRNKNEHAEILRALTKVVQVTDKLDDVLKHPSDTPFAVDPIRKELEDIRDELRRLRAS